MTEGKVNCSNIVVAENSVSEARELYKGLLVQYTLVQFSGELQQ